MYSWKSIADWILENIDDVTDKKLQKLMYFAYAWYLVFFNESGDEIDNRLFEGQFEAWVHGPVLPELYREVKRFHGNKIGADYFESNREDNFNPEVLDLLKQVKDVYGKYDGNELESITHQEDPWIDAREGCRSNEICKNPISDKAMFDYYVRRLDNE